MSLPAGAGKGGYSECVNGADTVAKFLQSAVFGAVNEFVYRSNLRGAGRLAAKEIPKLRSAKTAFRAKGFPAGHPVIRDIDQEIAAASALVTVAARSDRAALPRVFQQLSTAQDQFNRDTGHHICN